jgi:GNAT superfamily N-acetyltransferase
MVETLKVDILQTELEQNLPYWLDPSQKNAERHAEIRAKHRQRWLDEQKREKGWKRAKQDAWLLLRKYDESEHPRDERGRWTDAGGGDGGKPDVGTGSEKSKGDCMSAAYKWIKEHPEETLVHGMVTSDGKRFPHAWGEDNDGNVHEVSNGQNVVVPRAEYYERFEVKPDDPAEYHRYTHTEALVQSVRAGHYGPWDISEETVDLDRLEESTGGGYRKPGKKPSDLSDFLGKERVQISDNVDDPHNLIKNWNKYIGMDPEEFADSFFGARYKPQMTVSYGAGQIYVDALLQNPRTGEHLASVSRFINGPKNRATASFFEVDSAQQGKGIGKQVTASNVKMYADLGITEVHARCNINVGGYAWAKYGYVPRDREAWEELADKVQEKLENMDEDDVSDQERETIIELIDNPDPKAVWAIADSEVGKELLTDTEWDGVLDLTDKEVLERLNAYIGTNIKPVKPKPFDDEDDDDDFDRPVTVRPGDEDDDDDDDRIDP